MKSIYINKNIIGADETGVGDYLTPLVVAAVYVPYQNVSKLEKLGITDSKKITDYKITHLFNEIKSMIKSSVRIMDQKEYNKLNKKFNAHELKMYLHMKAISAVENRVDDVHFTILDAFSNEDSINKYRYKLISKEGFKDFKYPIKYITKAEMEHVSVAAASIVARSYFIELMKSQNEKWNEKFPLGTNNIVENFTIKFIKKHGFKKLNEIAKLSFKTTKKILERINND